MVWQKIKSKLYLFPLLRKLFLHSSYCKDNEGSGSHCIRTLESIAEMIDEHASYEYAYYDRETQDCVNSYLTSCYTMADIEDIAHDNNIPKFTRESVREHLDTLRALEEDIELTHQDNAHVRRFISLPDKFAIDDYSLMRKFINSQPPEIAQYLRQVFTGNNQDGYLRDLLGLHKLSEEWEEFRKAHLMKIAEEFCKTHGIRYRAAHGDEEISNANAMIRL